ncbi:hypothetical protein IJ674_02495 [bacterium]|nr:hypothetical protein [bacterium]
MLQIIKYYKFGEIYHYKKFLYKCKSNGEYEMYFGNFGMRMMMGTQMTMGLWGNFNMMNYMNPIFNPTGSIFSAYQFPMMNFNFQPMFYPMPTWNFGLTPGTNTPQTSTQTQEQINKTVDEIRKLNYNSPELKTKLNQNNNISDYANYFTSNSSFKVSNTIDTEDGGKISIYKDKDGNHIGSVRKNKDGKIENVAFDLADGGFVSLNDTNNDGKIDNKTSASAQQTQTDKNGQKFEKTLKDLLAKYPNATSTSENLENGEVRVKYTSNGKIVATVIKSSDGKIKEIFDESNTSSSGGTVFFYTDLNKNGKIDADEHKKRNDIEL